MEWKPPIVVERSTPYCYSGRDGDCYWKDCPQEKDNGAHRQSYCPYARYWEAIWELDI